MESIKTFSCRRAVIFFCLILVMGFGALYVFASQIKSVFQPRVIEIKNNGQAEKTANAGAKTAGFKLFGQEAAEPVNFLLLGAPGLGNDGADLTDTILLARLDEAKNKIYLFSLPRDLLVKIPGSENYTPTPNSQLKNSETEISSNSLKKDSVWGYTKLNALYAFNKNNAGREFVALIAKSQNITGLTINHYVFVDLQTVRQLVDIFGGVNVMVAKDILDPAFPGPNHSFETFEIKSGWRYLDGQTALKYLRSRASPAGDFDRMARQQSVLQALKQKVLALNFWDIGKFVEIYNALSANIKSDLSLWQIKNYWDKIKNIPGENVIKSELNNQNLLISGQMNLGGETASVVKPKAGIENYDDIKKYITETISN